MLDGLKRYSIMPKTPGKYSKYTKHYNKDWELEPQFKGWLQESRSKIGAFCKFCKSELRAQKNDLIKHAQTKIHLANQKKHVFIPLEGHRQLTDLGVTSVTTISNQMKVKELQLSVYIAMHSAIRSVDHLGEIINDENKNNNNHKKDIRLHRTKCSTLIQNVIAPAILNDLVEDLGDSKYSLILDESTDISIHKYMAVCIRYFSLKQSVMITEYFGLFEVGRARAEDLYEGLKDFLTENRLNIKNLIGLGTDGANNLCGKNNSLYTRLKNENPNLILLKCVCHSIHLCASKATEELPTCLDFLIRETYNWFSHSPLRRMNYENIYVLINDGKKPLNLVQLAATRWLSRYNCVERILSQWIELKTHFGIAAINEKCYSSRMLYDMYKDDKNYLFLYFLKPSLKELAQCNLFFQSENADVEIIHENLLTLISSNCKRILKQEFINKLNQETWQLNILSKILDNELAYENLQDIDFGVFFFMKLSESTISEEDKNILKIRCFNFLKQLCLHLLQKIPENMSVIEKIKMFSPKSCLNQVRPKFIDLPLNVLALQEETLIDLENQWRRLLSVNWVDVCDNTNNTINFWSSVLNYENALKQKPFFILAKSVLELLSIPVSNATVERVFSIMNSIKTKPRNRLSLKLLDALLRVRLYYCKKGCCKNFKATNKMLSLFSSSMYISTINNTFTAEEAEVIDDVWEALED